MRFREVLEKITPKIANQNEHSRDRKGIYFILCATSAESWGTQEKGVLTTIIEALGNFYYGVYLMFSLFLYIEDILKMIA